MKSEDDKLKKCRGRALPVKLPIEADRKKFWKEACVNTQTTLETSIATLITFAFIPTAARWSIYQELQTSLFLISTRKT